MPICGLFFAVTVAPWHRQAGKNSVVLMLHERTFCNFYIDSFALFPIKFNMSTHSAPTAANRLLSLQEAATYLHISERHVQTLRFKRLLPAIKLSPHCLRFRIADLDRALEKLTERELS